MYHESKVMNKTFGLKSSGLPLNSSGEVSTDINPDIL